MTISDTATKFRLLGNGVTDTFAFGGKAFTEDALVVEIITRATDVLEETLTLTTDYAVNILTDGTASIVTVAGKIPSNTQDIQVRRDLDKSQTTSLPVGTPFPAKLVENSMDKNTGLIQELGETLSRAITFPITSSVASPTFPTPVDDTVIVFDGITGGMKTGATNTSLIAGAAAADASAIAAAASASAASASAASAGTSETNAAASAAAISETVSVITSTSNVITADLSASRVFKHTFTENTTFTFSNPAATGTRSAFEIYLFQDGTGRTPTWPASVDWSNGVAPDLTTASKNYIVSFVTIDGGTIYIGMLAAESYA